MGRIVLLLLSVDFLDELSSGIPFVGSPGIQESFGLSYGMAAGWTLAALQALSLLVEPPLFVLADRYDRRFFVCGGLAALGGVCLLAAWAPVFGTLLVAMALFGPASGCGVTLAQATLMDAHPDRREQLMARWTFFGALGDIGTPALFALLARLALGWRAAFAICGAALLFYAALLWRRPFPARVGPSARPGVPLRSLVRSALGNRTLLVWLFGVWLCGLLDETLVAFGALHLRDALGAGIETRSFILAALMAGSLVGLTVADLLLARVRPMRLLRITSAGCATAYVAWVFADSIPASAALMFVTGLLSAALYPIAKAQAYRALPDRSGMVNALAHLFGPLTLVFPLALGLLADHAGLVAALLVLAAQPVGLLLIAATHRD